MNDARWHLRNGSYTVPSPDPRLLVLGALRIGDLWESIAIPELRVQARQVAEHITARG